MSRPARLVVLISGSGSNLQAILDACESGALNARVTAVVSNRKAAFGLERARQAHVPTLYLPLKPYTDAGRPRQEYDQVLADRLIALHPDLVVLAGWMHIFTPCFYESFRGRVINLHPALPGQFPGTHSIQRAYEAFRRGEIPHGGVMVHRAVPEVDAGDVIAREVVPILSTDTLETFEARVHETEHRLLVEAIRQILETLDE
jgi:formyltetrahydrofolate-dependent phosphoribosylglycinamide formyltransferase